MDTLIKKFMMKKIYFISTVMILSGCKKVNLDGLAFPSEKLHHYDYDGYADPEIVLPDAYKIEPVNHHLIELNSYSSEKGETQKIYGEFIGDTNTISTDSVIMYFHGQSRHNDFYWTRESLLANIGQKHQYAIFMIDYRGYGMSEGTSSEIAFYGDVDADID